MAIQIKVQDFEGPLDLLLFLIRQSEVEITDIPIASITRQYLEALEAMQQLDLEIAGEFILMAATLIQIKARMLLPRESYDGEEIEDPRKELVDRLLEYQQFREIADTFSRLEQEQRHHFYRRQDDFASVDPDIRDLTLQDVSLIDIARAFGGIMRRDTVRSWHRLDPIKITVEEQMELISDRLMHNPVISWDELLAEQSQRIYLVITFLAILELMKAQRIIVRQGADSGRIWVFRPDHFGNWMQMYYQPGV
ncbi:MAG: segregation/condensation protein A [Candidatus Delongbacteria bacterium]|nr:segregation/condensation protein A [Candidatus Delongbacteria bacterium]